jgi:hypothetical protein
MSLPGSPSRTMNRSSVDPCQLFGVTKVSGSSMKYRARPDATPNGERSALAAALRVLFELSEKRSAAVQTGGANDAKEEKHVRANGNIPLRKR